LPGGGADAASNAGASCISRISLSPLPIVVRNRFVSSIASAFDFALMIA
jgi:hypothetical protein